VTLQGVPANVMGGLMGGTLGRGPCHLLVHVHVAYILSVVDTAEAHRLKRKQMQLPLRGFQGPPTMGVQVVSTKDI